MMSDDINYCPSASIENLPATSPAHLPCPDMAGTANPDPLKRKRSLFLIGKLREKHGIQKRKQAKSSSTCLEYVCTEEGCIEPWGAVNNAVA